MHEAYYAITAPDSLGSFVGVKRQTKLSKAKISDFLSQQEAYTLHRNIKRKFLRRKTFSKGINDLWQADLVDLSSLARDNDGYRYLLTCIDVFSKIARAVPVRNKNAKSITDAFATLIVEEKPVFLQNR